MKRSAARTWAMERNFLLCRVCAVPSVANDVKELFPELREEVEALLDNLSYIHKHIEKCNSYAKYRSTRKK